MVEGIRIGGFQKQSLIDFPGKITSVVFTSGCNFRCGYCHNPELVLPEFFPARDISCETILAYLQKNQFLLDAVTITGGEPTMQVGLPLFIKEIKALGLQVKLDTNGTHPEMVKSLVGNQLIDYVAMDIKAPLSLCSYRKVVGNNFSENQLEKIKETACFLNEGNVPCEFRTTLAKPLLSVEDIKKMTGELSGDYYLQQFVSGKCLSGNAGRYDAFEINETVSAVNSVKRENLTIRLRT